MEVFRDLVLTGDEAALTATAEVIERTLSDGWRRSPETESRVKAGTLGQRPTYCFTCEPNGTRVAADLFLMGKDNGSLAVTNIIPKGDGPLSTKQYNVMIKEFHDRFVLPAVQETELDVRFTSDEKGIEDWLGNGAAEKFHEFISVANKSTGSAHPNEKERWFAFLKAASEDQSRLDPATLSRWLVETEHWGEDVASDLAVEYEFGRELLAFAETHRTDQ